MTKQTLVQTWLSAIGLAPHIIETFEAAGIVNPTDLAELEICHYPALGVQEPGDRKKLFYLVQRIKLAVPENDDDGSTEDAAVIANITVSGVNAIEMSTSSIYGENDNSEPLQQRQQPKKKMVHGTESNHLIHTSEFEVEDDAIDEALQEQYKPLLSPSSSVAKLSSEEELSSEDESSSSERVPSPPKDYDGTRYDLGSYDNVDDGLEKDYQNSQSPSRNKRESEFLNRMNARLSKITRSPKKEESDGTNTTKVSKDVSTATAAKRRVNTKRNKNDGEDRTSRKPRSRNSSVTKKLTSETSTLSKSRIRRANFVRKEKTSSAVTTSTSSEAPEETQSQTSSKKSEKSASSLIRKPFIERNKKMNMSSSNSARTSETDEIASSDIKTRRTSRRLQERKAKEILPDRDEESSIDTRRSNLSSCTTPANVEKRVSSVDENDLDAILGDSIFPVSPDSIPSDSSSSGTSDKRTKKKTSNPTTKRLATIPSGRVAIPVNSFSSLQDDEDPIFPAQSSTNNQKTNTRKSMLSSFRANSAPRQRDEATQSSIIKSIINVDVDIKTSKSSDNQENGTMASAQDRRKSVKNSSNGMIFVHGKRKKESWTSKVASLWQMSEQHYQDHLKVGSLDNDFIDEMRIRVVVRKRPMSRKEAAHADDADVIHPLQYNDYGRILVYQPKTRVDLTREVETLPFAFDNVFSKDSTNCQIYDETIKNLIPGAFEGRWASVFAYGQTGSGKTFTMMGSTLTGIKSKNRNVKHDENYGLYLLAARDIFKIAKRREYSHFVIGASLFEIYGGKLFDLLNERAQVKCLENHQGRVCFPGLSEHNITSADDLMKLIEKGASNRSTGSTSANRDSSRSHAVLQMHLRKPVGSKGDVEHGRLTFIDLAGSERGADNDQASRTTRLEGAEINTSLLALKEVIRALATGDAMAHIPFRGSKLTQVLKESFVGKSSRSVMVACVAPNMTNCDHTLNTLRYADRVKERNSETGELTEAIKAASQIQQKRDPMSSSRAMTAPPASNDLSRAHSKASLIQTYGDDDWLDALDGCSNDEFDDDDSTFKVSMDELNEVLKTPVQDTAKSFKFSDDEMETDVHTDESNWVKKKLEFKSKKEAVAPLISTHRSIMSEMLGMVKQEMTLVNCTDEDRGLIDEYLDELEDIQNKQLSMISTLRESLVEYYGNRKSDEAEDSFDALLTS